MNETLPQKCAEECDTIATLADGPRVGMVSLRGSPDDPNFTACAEKIVGISLPSIPNRFNEAERSLCIRQGADEWLLFVPEGHQQTLIEDLEAAMDGLHHAVTDVTGNRAVLRLSGARSQDVLARGCSLDLSDRAFPCGSAAQTILARTHVTILRRNAAEFEIYIGQSYRTWLRSWLLYAGVGWSSPGANSEANRSQPDPSVRMCELRKVIFK